MNKKSWLCIILACAFTLSAFNSCKKDEDDTAAGASSGPTAALSALRSRFSFFASLESDRRPSRDHADRFSFVEDAGETGRGGSGWTGASGIGTSR